MSISEALRDLRVNKSSLHPGPLSYRAKSVSRFPCTAGLCSGGGFSFLWAAKIGQFSHLANFVDTLRASSFTLCALEDLGLARVISVK